MSRSSYAGPKLPRTLLDQVQGSNGSGRKREVSRKDRRKAERQQKRPPPTPRKLPVSQHRSRRPGKAAYEGVEEDEGDEDDFGFEDSSPEPQHVAKKSTAESKPLKSILKKDQPPVSPAEESPEVPQDDFSDAEDSDASDASSFVVSARAAKEGLAGNDAEIAALEKKLGVKSGKKSKSVDDAELDWLMGGGESDSEEDQSRKRSDDTKWLRDKRLKATGRVDEQESADSDGFGGFEDEGSADNDEDADMDGLDNPFSEDEVDSDDFDELESDADEDEQTQPKKPRENPYVAPVSRDAAPAKYIPPSLRKPASSDDESLKQLRRQVQGQLNRLSEANILSIVSAIEEIYTNNARQNVTSTLVDLLTGLVANPATLNDPFLILHAAFSTAIYKVSGTDFGAQLLEAAVETYDKHQADSEGKQCLNLLAFLCCLYNFQLVGSTMVFDYIRNLLGELSENNTELLLRVIRTSGPQLRSDDPSSLKDIVLLLQRSVAEKGEEQLSVRTKFMIEAINNLKNNRLKGGAAASAVAAEKTTQLKKTLSTLNSRAKASEPIRISLADIKESEKKGKWWLVGASYHDPAKMANNSTKTTTQGLKLSKDEDDGYESETLGHVNLQRLARQQGMNTDVRRAIFISILSAADYIDAHMRLVKLHLKTKQQIEIPRVLVHCAGAEQVYNPYYALIARKFCGEHRLRKAFAFNLWDAFKQMEEKEDDDDDEDEEAKDASSMSMRKVVHLAKFYGDLVAQRDLDIAILKKLDFAYLAPDASMFVEVFLTTIFSQARSSSEGFETVVRNVFETVHRAPTMISGLTYFVETTVSKAELAKRKKEAKAVREGCALAVEVMQEAAKHAPTVDDDDDENDDDGDD